MSNPHTSAQTNIDSYPTPFIEYKPEPNYWLRRAMAIGIVASLAVGAVKGVDYVTTPKDQIVYSSDTRTEVAQDESDTIWKYANTIKGVGSIVTTQEAANYLLEINPDLEDGLSQGEAVEIPAEVKVVEPVDSKE